MKSCAVSASRMRAALLAAATRRHDKILPTLQRRGAYQHIPRDTTREGTRVYAHSHAHVRGRVGAVVPTGLQPAIRHGIFLPGLRWQRLQKNRCAAMRSLSLQWTKAALGRLELKKASRWMLSTMPSTAAVPLPTTARGTTGRKGQARAEAGTPLVDRRDTATDTSGMTPALDAPTPFDCPFMGRYVWRSGRSVCVQRSQPRSKAHLHSTRVKGHAEHTYTV